MKPTARYLRIFFGIAVALLCFVVYRMGISEDVRSPEPVAEITEAALSEKQNDMLRVAHEMGQWGIPSTSVTLQGTGGRMLGASKTLQRISRSHSALCASEPRSANDRDEALSHTLLTKRFHTGYYIYYRCQMRC